MSRDEEPPDDRLPENRNHGMLNPLRGIIIGVICGLILWAIIILLIVRLSR